jgi:MFS family permease
MSTVTERAVGTAGSHRVGDHTVRRFGAAAVVRVGALVAAVGLLCVIVAPSPYLAIGAFALTGLGFCMVPPQCFSATSKLDPTGSGIAISGSPRHSRRRHGARGSGRLRNSLTSVVLRCLGSVIVRKWRHR